MEIRTLRGVTNELSGRTLNPTLESYFPQYAVEIVGVLQAVQAAARQFPAELAPSTVFVLKQSKVDK